MHFSGVTKPYRIGGPRRGRHWAHRWHVDLWFRSWQSEDPEVCRFARRAWTARGAERKMRRDAWLARRGVTSLHQWRRTRFAAPLAVREETNQ